MVVNSQCKNVLNRVVGLCSRLPIKLTLLGTILLVSIYPIFAVSADNVSSQVYPPGGSHKGENVPQPIEFPHNIHVKDNGINCMYCHTYARRSKVAGIPPTSKCMGCHKQIATDKPRIQEKNDKMSPLEKIT